MKEEYYNLLRAQLKEIYDANALYCRSIENGHDDVDALELLEQLKCLLISTVEDILDEVDRDKAREE